MTARGRDEAPPLYLAVDQGGHASRALVFDAAGSVVARGVTSVRVRRSHPDRVEQDPEELVDSVRDGIRHALAELGDASQRIVGAGLATQRASIVCWDRISGAALSPVISWQDRRAHQWLASLAGRVEEIHRTTGLMLSAHYGASKLRWCLDHLDAVQVAHRDHRLCFGPLASFLVFCLVDGAPFLADPANAARTLLWSLRRRDWDPRLLALFGVPAGALPRCVPSRHAYGDLMVAGRRFPLQIVTGDQSAAIYAHGEPEPDTIHINMGTGAFAQRVVGDQLVYRPGLLTSVVLQEDDRLMCVLEGTVNGAGAALESVGQQLGVTDAETNLSDWMTHAGNPPLFLNGVSGLGAPFWVANFRSRFLGEGEPWVKLAAVGESIVFLLAVIVELLGEQPSPVRRMIVSGGLAEHDALCQRLSDVTAMPVYRPSEHEATARGTAYLLANRPPAWPEPRAGRQFQPRIDPVFAARYRRWRNAMSAALADGRHLP